MTKKLLLILSIIGLSFSATASDNLLPDNFNDIIVKEMAKWHAPGLSLAIVKDGEIILTKG